MEWMQVARCQAGVVTRAQLRDCGIAARTIDNWCAAGRLERTRIQGVYRIGGAPATAETAAWFAVLGTRSPLSYLSAGR